MPSVNGTDLNAKRAQVAAQVKCDILTATQDADNDAQRISIGRSFICEFSILAQSGDSLLTGMY